jgi:hypothetical protein
MEQNRCAESKAHFEKVTRELTQKIEWFQSKESDAVAKVAELELELTKCQSAIAQLNVANKMALLKVKAGEEKSIRVESTLESKHRLLITKLESEYEGKLERLRANHADELSRIFTAICEEFKNFCDSSEPISEPTVFHIINRAAFAYERELTVIRQLKQEFEVADSKDLSYAIAQRMAQYHTESPAPVEVKHVQIDAGWVSWANRLAILLTNRVWVGRTQTELQNLIEESLLDSLGSKSLWRTVDRLRTVKRLLDSGVANVGKSATRKWTFRSVMTVAIAACRIQTLSGHSPAELFGALPVFGSSTRPDFPVLALCDDSSSS